MNLPPREDSQTKQNKIQEDKAIVLISRLDKATQQEEKSPKSSQESDTAPIPLLGLIQNTKLTAITYSQGRMVQTPAGPMFVALVCVSPCEPCLVAWRPPCPLTPFSVELTNLLGEGPNGNLKFFS